ncbi:unnamed protein product, partial [Symbiodinium sp. CCMP2592]
DLAALKLQLAKLWDREPDEQAGEAGSKLQPHEAEAGPRDMWQSQKQAFREAAAND